TWAGFWKAYPNFIGLGPLWFVAMLLVFNLGYVIWRVVMKKTAAQTESSPPTYLGIGIFILALAGISYLWRMVIPLGQSVWQFPTLAYLPQYLTFFMVGLVAYRKDWFRNIPGSMGLVGFIAAIIAGIILFPLAFSGEMFSLELSDALDIAFGNGTWQSAVYTLWDSIFAVGISLGLLTFFRRFANRSNWFGTFLAQNSYTVYLIHIPLIVFIAYGMRNIMVGSLPKFGLASLVIVPVCFIAAAAIRKIPGVSRVL
ncbi:MAG: acyltransferase family protein, partial [Anaerolineales bacterium]